MDQYLDMLIESSAISAKASLLTAMFDVANHSRHEMRKLFTLMSDVELDRMLSFCSTMSGNMLQRLSDLVIHEAFLGTDGPRDFKNPILLMAALAPTIEAFDPDCDDPQLDVHAISRYLKERIDSGRTPVPDVDTMIALARGACIRFHTSGFETSDDATDAEMLWLSINHDRIVLVADALTQRRSSDPMLITSLLSGATALHSGGSL